MASSNRRKKQNRAKAAAKHAEARRRRAATARIRAVQARFGRIHDPETPAAELAVLLAQHYQGVPVAGWLVSALLDEGSSLARLQDAAKLMLADQDAPSLTALTFAASVARAAGNTEEEQRLIEQALAADEAGDPDVRLEVIDFITASGHAAEAAELLEHRLREAPDDDFAADLHGVAVERAYAKASAEESADRERAVVHRFADRTGLIALKDAVSALLDGTELGEAVQARVIDELSVTDDLDWSPEDRVAFGKLAEELALLTVDPGHDEDETPDDVEDLLDEDDPAGTPLRMFAADPSTPPILAARALAWHQHIHYGLWRIDDPVPAPGLRCTDIVSGAERYVEFPAEATAGLPRWMVWLGGIVPVDGVWRSTGVGVKLSPAEGDAAAEFIDQAGLAMAHALAGQPDVPTTPIPFGHAEPHGVYADDQEPVSAEVASLMGKVTGAMITRIAADVHRYRAMPPTISNTDGDPMCLITAPIAVEEGTVGKLAARPDFDLDTGEPDRVTWWGALIPDGQREAMMAEAMAQLRAQGHKDVEAPGGPQRWVWGVLRARGREVTVEVNSAQRLTRLVDILRKVGADPVITSEKRIDPAMDLAWAAGQRASRGGAAAAAEGWEKSWLDEKVPALFGRTPGRAARGRSGRSWRRCCGNSSTRPTSSPPMARPASTPPGCASNSTCQATSPTERLGGVVAHPGRDLPTEVGWHLEVGLTVTYDAPAARCSPTSRFRRSRKAQRAQQSPGGIQVRPSRMPRISAKLPRLNSAR
jgi:hypothetical protein